MSKLEVREITYKFFDTGRGCENISFFARLGELTVLSAPSGRGKSTLLAAIAGVLKAQSGEVLYDGVTLSPSECTLVLQGAQVFEGLKAWENVACAWGGPSVKNRRRAIAELRKYGLKNVASSRSDQMSGGEKGRVALVTALAQDKKVLLVDEPTSSLDDPNAYLVIEALKRAASERIVIVASHDSRISDVADKIVTI